MLDVPRPEWTGALPYAISARASTALLHERHARVCVDATRNDGKINPSSQRSSSHVSRCLSTSTSSKRANEQEDKCARSSNVGAMTLEYWKSRQDFETMTVIMRSVKPRLYLPHSFSQVK